MLSYKIIVRKKKVMNKTLFQALINFKFTYFINLKIIDIYNLKIFIILLIIL